MEDSKKCQRKIKLTGDDGLLFEATPSRAGGHCNQPTYPTTPTTPN